jgi:hypothetical protein
VLVATQLCSKHISAAVNQCATIKEVVFSVGPPLRLYNEDLAQLELELRQLAVVVRRIELSSRVRSCSRVESSSGVGSCIKRIESSSLVPSEQLVEN